MTQTFHAADGAELSYVDRGPRGDIALLFVHGWNASSDVWGPLMDLLAARRRTIGMDVRGFGGSHAARGPYTVENFSDDLSALIAFADLDPLVVVGHSMGAAIAQRFAIDRPEVVEGLVLIAPVPASGMDFPPKVDAFFRSLPGNLEATNAWLAKLTYEDPPPQIRAIMRDAAALVDPAVALESYESWSRLHFADEAATIATPTLVIAPAGDRPDFARERVADLIEGSRFEIMPKTGHYAPLERPAAIARLIERFIEDL
jgi:pimeloyl-ACP methyl ester carboxylesterase